MTRRHWWQFWRRKPVARLYATLDTTIEGKYTVLTMGGCGNDVRYQTYVSGEAAAQAVEIATQYKPDEPPLQPNTRNGVD